MSAFDAIERSDTGPHPHGESEYQYLNRSGRVEAGRVRELIDDWVLRYPQEHRGALVRRLRSSIDGGHRSAFFELLLHELLLRRGHTIVAIEPDVPGTSRRPDFLVQTLEGARYYLEAVMARGLPDAQVAAERRLNVVLRAIDEINSPHHFLDLRTHGTPNQNVSINDLCSKLRKWIEALPHGEAAGVAPPFTYQQHGMKITLTAWPRKGQGGPARAIGVRHFPPTNVTRAADIGAAVEFKARRYGTALDLPLLVAVSGFERFRHDDDVVDLVLGTEVVQSRQGADGRMITSAIRKDDGLGPRRRVMSGVLWFKQIDPWNFAARDPLIVANPWAKYIMPTLKLGIRELYFAGDRRMETLGGCLADVFGLPPTWPED